MVELIKTPPVIYTNLVTGGKVSSIGIHKLVVVSTIGKYRAQTKQRATFGVTVGGSGNGGTEITCAASGLVQRQPILKSGQLLFHDFRYVFETSFDNSAWWQTTGALI